METKSSEQHIWKGGRVVLLHNGAFGKDGPSSYRSHAVRAERLARQVPPSDRRISSDNIWGTDGLLCASGCAFCSLFLFPFAVSHVQIEFSVRRSFRPRVIAASFGSDTEICTQVDARLLKTEQRKSGKEPNWIVSERKMKSVFLS